MSFEEIYEEYEVFQAESIRYDYQGMHHTGFDAIDENGEEWGIFEVADDDFILAR